MSLVVARKIAGEVRIVSDTKITRSGALHESPVDGGLKCVVISPTCCVSFAGNVRVAEQALSPLIRNSSCSRLAITSHLLSQHQGNGCSTDFVVVTTGDATFIDRIGNGSLEQDLPAAWIGDPGAFAAYQASYHTALARMPSSLLEDTFLIAGAMVGALRDVIADSRFESVSDFAVTVTSQPAQQDGFRYLSYAFGSGFRAVANTTEETSLIQSVGAEGGSYHYCVLVPTTAGVGALAVYIREARLGVLFCPSLSWAPTKMTNVDPHAFVEHVRARTGISLDGIRA